MGRPLDPAPAGGILRGAEDGRPVSFLELFFDLVLVFALLGVVSRIVPDLLSDDVRQQWLSLVYTLVLALPLLWLWTTTAYITSRFDHRNPWIQLVVLVSAFGLLIMSTSLPYEFRERGAAFAVGYVVLHVGRPLLLRPLLRGHEEVRAYYTRVLIWAGASGVIWLAGAVLRGNPRVALWLIAITVDLVVARLGWPVPSMRRQPVLSAWATASCRNLSERYQLLLLIALGEAVVSIGVAYSRHAATLAATTGLVVTFLSAVLMWRIYFYSAGQVLAEAVEKASDRAAVGGIVGAAHLLMVLGITATAAGSELVLAHPGTRSHPASIALILGGPAIFLVGRSRLERVVFNRLAVRRLVAVAALVLLAPPLLSGPPMLAALVTVVVLAAVAVADARRAAGRPPEVPSPSA